jgi:hypothetical protein
MYCRTYFSCSYLCFELQKLESVHRTPNATSSKFQMVYINRDILIALSFTGTSVSSSLKKITAVSSVIQ